MHTHAATTATMTNPGRMGPAPRGMSKRTSFTVLGDDAWALHIPSEARSSEFLMQASSTTSARLAGCLVDFDNPSAMLQDALRLRH